MRGHVRKRGKTWSYVINLGQDDRGRRKQKWVGGFKTRREAETAVTQALTNLQQGSYIVPSKQKLSEYLEEWLAAIESTIEVSTFASYRALLRRHVIPAVGTVPLRNLDPAHLNRLYGELLRSGRQKGGGLSARTVRYVHVVIHRALKDAVRWGRIQRNVADLADPPKSQTSRDSQRTWSGQQAQQLFETMREDRLYALAVLYLTTGARKGEVAGLKWTELDLDRREMQVVRSRSSAEYKVYETAGKRESSRRLIELDTPTVAALKSWRAQQIEERLAAGPAWEETGYVFTDEFGRPPHPDSIYRMLRQRVQRAGIPWIGIKGMRHTWATLALKNGEQLKVVSERLGHASTKITSDVYQHVLPGMQREAAERVADLIFRPNG